MIVLRLSTFVEAVHLNDFKWILTLSIMQCNNCWILQKVQSNFFKMCVRFGPYPSGRQNEWIPGQLTELDRSEPSHLRLLCINVDLSRIFINRSHLQTDKALNSRYTFSVLWLNSWIFSQFNILPPMMIWILLFKLAHFIAWLCTETELTGV